MRVRLSDDEGVFVGEVIFRDFEVQWRGSFSCSAGYQVSNCDARGRGKREKDGTDIVVGSVAGTEPSSVVA